MITIRFPQFRIYNIKVSTQQARLFFLFLLWRASNELCPLCERKIASPQELSTIFNFTQQCVNKISFDSLQSIISRIFEYIHCFGKTLTAHNCAQWICRLAIRTIPTIPEYLMCYKQTIIQHSICFGHGNGKYKIQNCRKERRIITLMHASVQCIIHICMSVSVCVFGQTISAFHSLFIQKHKLAKGLMVLNYFIAFDSVTEYSSEWICLLARTIVVRRLEWKSIHIHSCFIYLLVKHKWRMMRDIRRLHMGTLLNIINFAWWWNKMVELTNTR